MEVKIALRSEAGKIKLDVWMAFNALEVCDLTLLWRLWKDKQVVGKFGRCRKTESFFYKNLFSGEDRELFDKKSDRSVATSKNRRLLRGQVQWDPSRAEMSSENVQQEGVRRNRERLAKFYGTESTATAAAEPSVKAPTVTVAKWVH